MHRAAIVTVPLQLILASARMASAAPCDSVASLKLPHTRVIVAQAIESGTFAIPPDAAPTGVGAPSPDLNGLPPFCRVAASITPSADSDIRIEVWLPRDGWNGQFMAVGNGGWSGSISYRAMAPVLKRGYAVASTDTGHQSAGDDARWAMGHPEKQIDFGWRAVHEMTIAAKALVDAYYGSAPTRAYWNGCSSGGKQGLKEAQQFPDDYDGIIAGAPANNWTALSAELISVGQADRNNGAQVIPVAKYPLIHEAVLKQCDALDGVRDGLLEDPRRCAFDPASIQCRDGDRPDCLTAAEASALQRVYAPLRDSTGKVIFPGFERGGERRWGKFPIPFPIAESHFKYVVFGNPDWDYRTFQVDRDLKKAEEIDASVGHFDATDPDLQAFRRRGGKLLQYHGWSDQFIPPQSSITYYERVVSTMGGPAAVSPFYRLFLVPGMGHCGGGDGPNQFDAIGALEQWVEHGTAPDRMVAAQMSGGAVERTRPLCPYPLVARWTGSGSIDDEKKFQCVAAVPNDPIQAITRDDPQFGTWELDVQKPTFSRFTK